MTPFSEVPRSPQSNSQAATNPEVAGMFDAFISLEEIAPDLDWTEAIADSWGIPIEVNQEAPKAQEP